MKTYMRFGAFFVCAVAFGVLSSQASASTVTIVSQNTTDFSAVHPLPANITQPDVQTISGTINNNIQGSSAGVYRSPFENLTTPGYGYGAWASMNYDSIQGGASGYLNITGTDLYMLWGSPDSYNSISLCTGADGLGSCTLAAYVPGVAPITYGHDYIHFQADFTFGSVLFSTGQNALEFADISTTPNGALQPTPLPAALPLFGGGLMLGYLGLRKKRKKSAMAAP